MKEKIGIEKLHELLFEYSENKSYYWALTPSGKIEGDVGGTDHTLEGEEVSMVIKSKEFGFIKWLVDNDKIDFEGMSGHGKIISYLTDEKDYKWNDIKEGVVLMLLAIQDNPIDFLISILK